MTHKSIIEKDILEFEEIKAPEFWFPWLVKHSIVLDYGPKDEGRALILAGKLAKLPDHVEIFYGLAEKNDRETIINAYVVAGGDEKRLHIVNLIKNRSISDLMIMAAAKSEESLVVVDCLSEWTPCCLKSDKEVTNLLMYTKQFLRKNKQTIILVHDDRKQCSDSNASYIGSMMLQHFASSGVRVRKLKKGGYVWGQVWCNFAKETKPEKFDITADGIVFLGTFDEDIDTVIHKY